MTHINTVEFIIYEIYEHKYVTYDFRYILSFLN